MATHYALRSQLLAWGLLSGLVATALQAQPPQTRPQAGEGPPAAERRVQPVPESPSSQEGNWPQTRRPGQRNTPDAAPSANGAAEANRDTYQAPSAEMRVNPGIAPPSQNWFIGVYPERAPRGVRIDRVINGSPAHRFGLEPGDYILDVGGFVVGDYQGTYYPLPMAMDYGVGPDGWAELLVWNKRTYAEETIWIQFQRR